MDAQTFIAALDSYADPARAVHSQRFFKTGPGQYSEGDVFIGVTVPNTRKVCKQFKDLPLAELQKLLDSPVHEHRLAAVIILCGQYKKANDMHKQNIYDLYLQELKNNNINNWDIVDTSAGYLVGQHNKNTNRQILITLARSNNLWERRVSIIATSAYIATGDPTTTLSIATILLHDSHDLIHKAVGWMLREVGKRIDQQILTDFLEQYAGTMPRTMLRYACEHLPKDQRTYFYNK